MQKRPFSKSLFLIFFVLLAAGGIGTALAMAAGPVLTIPTAIPANPNSTVTIPVIFTGNGNDIASVVFSIDYDEDLLAYDPSIPSAIVINVPAAFIGFCEANTADTDGEIDCFMYDPSPPLSILPDSTLAMITLRTANIPGMATAFVKFSTDPNPSFGNTAGQSVAGSDIDGSVKIGDQAKVFIPLVIFEEGAAPVSTATATRTSTATSTATTTATSTATPTASKTATPRPTRTPFWQTRTPTSTSSPTATPTEDLCSNIILNKGFEDPSDLADDGWGWELPATEYTARITQNRPRVGEYSLETGIIDPGDNLWSYSSGYQAVTIPSGISSATLSFWNYTTSNDAMVRWLPTIFWNIVAGPPSLDEPATYDMQYMAIEDLTVGGTAQIRWGGGTYNNQYWDFVSLDLLSLGYGNHVLRIWFSSFNDGWGGITSMYVDDVKVEICD
jgi:hypothetical protein